LGVIGVAGKKKKKGGARKTTPPTKEKWGGWLRKLREGCTQGGRRNGKFIRQRDQKFTEEMGRGGKSEKETL